ncbi:MAG: hypothetical protein NXI31_18025 [bacterium]|nr:hypothetical protein [bacterium]
MQTTPILCHPALAGLLLATASTLAAVDSATAQTPVVSPADRVGLEGNTFTNFPLGRHNCRMQTLHTDVPGGTVITGHAYRRDAAGLYGAVGGFSAELEIVVSMAPHTPDQASGTFSQNVGPSPVVVLPRTPVGFVGTTRPALDPAATFALQVPYRTPFVVPASGGTVCVDVIVWGNSTANGPDRDFSVYLDGHRNYSNGDAEQPAFRYGGGCAPPAGTTTTTAAVDLWHLGTGMEIDLSVRYGVADSGNNRTRAWIALGNQPGFNNWPLLPQCPLYSSNDVWFAMPGTMTTQGRYDGVLQGLPVLPDGYRIWLQAGSIDLGSGAMSFSNGMTLVTPPAGPSPIPVVRIVNSSNRLATTGTVSASVPVIEFF